MTASWMRHMTGFAHAIRAIGSNNAVTVCGVILPKPLDRVPLDKHGTPSGGYSCPKCLQLTRRDK